MTLNSEFLLSKLSCIKVIFILKLEGQKLFNTRYSGANLWITTNWLK